MSSSLQVTFHTSPQLSINRHYIKLQYHHNCFIIAIPKYINAKVQLGFMSAWKHNSVLVSTWWWIKWDALLQVHQISNVCKDPNFFKSVRLETKQNYYLNYNLWKQKVLLWLIKISGEHHLEFHTIKSIRWVNYTGISRNWFML